MKGEARQTLIWVIIFIVAILSIFFFGMLVKTFPFTPVEKIAIVSLIIFIILVVFYKSF